MDKGHKLSRAQKRAQTQARNDASAVLNHAPSVRFLCRLLERSGYFEDQFTSNNDATNYRLGKRRTGMDIVEELRLADPNALLKLVQAASNTRDEAVAKARDDTDET